MFHYDRNTLAIVLLVETDDRLGVVMQCMTSEELHPSALEIGIDLRCHHHCDLMLACRIQKDLGLPDEIIAGGGVLVVETIEHGKGVDDDEGDRTHCGELLDLVYPIGLLLETVDLEDEEVPHGILMTCEDLRETVR